MKNDIGDTAKKLHQVTGNDFFRYSTSFLENTISKRLKDLHLISLEEYLKIVKANAKEQAVLDGMLTVAYSEFFRNSLTFAVLEHLVLPSLVYKVKEKKRPEIRIWSTACAGGEEAYSLAILLEEIIGQDRAHISYRIFASDAQEEMITKARNGIYTTGQLNNLSIKRVHRWFTEEAGNFTVIGELKRSIEFSVFDLHEAELNCPPASIYGDFDLVVCANMLFYYEPAYRKQILEKAGGCLKPHGYLVTGEVEREILSQYSYREIYQQSAVFQKIAEGW